MSEAIDFYQRHQYWREHIEAWRVSGLSGAAYCEFHRLVYHRFTYWRKKFSPADRSDQLLSGESSGFVRVIESPTECAAGLSLVLPNGLVIQDIRETNVAVVRQLLSVL